MDCSTLFSTFFQTIPRTRLSFSMYQPSGTTSPFLSGGKFQRTTSIRALTAIHVLALVSAFWNLIRFALPFGDYLWAFWDALSLSLVDCVRLSAGKWAAKDVELCARPTRPLVLYEFEACPSCRRVRETLSTLCLDYCTFPCPRETLKSATSTRPNSYRKEAAEFGVENNRFPFLIDLDARRAIQGGSRVVEYLWVTYGNRAVAPRNYRIAHWPPYLAFSLKLCLLLRPCLDMGILRVPSRSPAQPLELWGFESSPFVRRVREVLTCLELPYFHYVLPWGAVTKRVQFRADRGGHFGLVRDALSMIQVPFLRDPNTDVELFESSDIVRYLQNEYRRGNPPSENWLLLGELDGRRYL